MSRPPFKAPHKSHTHPVTGAEDEDFVPVIPGEDPDFPKNVVADDSSQYVTDDDGSCVMTEG